MNDETTLHVKLLDELDSSVDRAATGLRAETKHAETMQSCNLVEAPGGPGVWSRRKMGFRPDMMGTRPF